MPLVSDLLERKQELGEKAAYSPMGREAEYLGELKAKYIRSLWYIQSAHRYFNDKTLQAYMDRAADDSFLYVKPTPKDNWHAKTRTQRMREKANAVLAAILDQDLSPDIYSFDEKGRDERNAADVAQSLISHSDYIEDANEKKKMRAYELLRYGTVANEVSWLHTEKIVKRMTEKFNPKTGRGKWEGKTETDFEGVWTKIIPLNRILLGDITKYFVEEQPYIWKEYVMTYDEAYVMFHDWKNWCYVSPLTDTEDSWQDTVQQVDTEQSDYSDNNYVRMRIYENKWSDEYAIILNGVLMTPVGMALPSPDKKYSFTWTQLEMFDQAFAYGRSFFAVLHNDSIILDFLYNAMIDKARQGLEPPLITSFKNLVNKNIFAPGKISQGDVNFKRAVDHDGVTNADIEIARFVEENIDKSSVSPNAQGQGATGTQTAYEIREQHKNALRLLGLTLYSIARMEKDIAEKKLSYILKHYPDMKVASLDKKANEVVQSSKTFIVRGETTKRAGVGRKEIAFGKVPSEAPQIQDLLTNMMQEEDASAVGGERMKKTVVDPEYLRKLKYVFQIIVNPSQRKSKLADLQEIREKYAMYIQNPIIDPEWATRLLLRANEDDEEAAIKKNQPPPQQQQMQPGMPGQPQPGGPTANPNGAVPTRAAGSNTQAIGAANNKGMTPQPNQNALNAAPKPVMV